MKPDRQGIDWSEVRGRLEQSARALDRALAASPERIEAAYRERAARLGGRGVQASVPAGGLRVLAFTLGADRYALEFADLVELLPLTGFTPVPGGPPELLGVINVRGAIRSVVDLALLLGLPRAEAPTPGYVLLVRRQRREVCLRVDRLDRIHLLAPAQLAAPAEGDRVGVFQFVRAVAPDKLRLLGTDALLTHRVFQGGPDAHAAAVAD